MYKYDKDKSQKEEHRFNENLFLYIRVHMSTSLLSLRLLELTKEPLRDYDL